MMSDAFRDTIRAAGYQPPDSIEPGRFHRDITVIAPSQTIADGKTPTYSYATILVMTEPGILWTDTTYVPTHVAIRLWTGAVPDLQVRLFSR